MEYEKILYDIQVEYVNSIMSRFDVGLSAISREVFGKASQVLSTYFARKDELQYVNTFKGRHSSVGIENLRKAMKEKIDDICETKVEVPVVESNLSILHMTVDINGFDDDIWNRIKTLFDGQKVSVKISVFAGN